MEARAGANQRIARISAHLQPSNFQVSSFNNSVYFSFYTLLVQTSKSCLYLSKEQLGMC